MVDLEKLEDLATGDSDLSLIAAAVVDIEKRMQAQHQNTQAQHQNTQHLSNEIVSLERRVDALEAPGKIGS